MSLGREHPLHARRRGRNFGVLVLLVCFAALVFAITLVKMSTSGPIEGFNHTYRPELMERAR